MTKRFKSVFDAIADTPQEALNLKLRAQLMNEIIDNINHQQWTQKDAAKYLNVTQPRISDLLRGKISLFSLDLLVNMLASLGNDVELKIKVA